ncbi:hypothetical protein M409DRAFT_62703 [Zasmidium cellare ATCC 36951]|uniref:DUF221-domain-containing protein n=1 Tax=Zasmidium cellare ATCC 36951 TaxID=1080233 RepID=A0A6A6D1N5_ZASCE|nr:uncharacterized protein M409DRAFT_62703 [Zasmidium cellare ATCC 36951]KAF2173095.1 hypothetical protein M409DRAFT_62703 [Zasmidium cellare ATCC 36951]
MASLVGERATHAFLVPRASASSNTGSHRDSGSSVSALLSTLIPVLAVSAVLFIAFLIFQKKYERVYGPRTYLSSLRNWQKSPKRTAGLLGWKSEYQQLKDEFVLGHSSIDNYLWLRLFKMLAIMCFVGAVITWPILFPVNATGGAPGVNGLDILSFSKIQPGPRYYAQVFVSWMFLAFVMFLITREARYCLRLRQQYLASPYEKSRISNKTILFVNVPQEARNEEYLRKEFSDVKHVWLVSVPEDLAKKVEERDKAAAKLENGEIKLIKNHIKRENKRAKKEAKGKLEPRRVEEGREHIVNVEQKDRPTHRLPKLKFLPIGKKVDTLDWSRGELHRLIPDVAKEQNEARTDKSNVGGACFIEFESIYAAHTALNQAGLKNKAKLTPKDIGTPPQNVIWKNAVKPFAKFQLFNILCSAFVWFLCIFWTIPVAVIGAISNINYLTDKVPFLSFINHIPKVILGVVTGLLPVILLSILMTLVPIVCNILAKLYQPTQASVQMKVQGWYFPFQVIQVFLVTTFASGASSVVTSIINQPSQAPTLLATNLPKASNFYISYFILIGVNTAVMQLLQVVPLLFVLFLGKLLDTTPRKMFNRYVNLAGLGWGSLYPVYTNLGVIALSYSTISPLILGFAAIGFTLLYAAFRYNALFTLGTTVSTNGRSYARALQQLTTGIYLSEVCLIGLFAIGVGQTNQAIGPLVLQVIWLVATIVWHVWLNRSLKKMEQTLPEDEVVERIAQQNQDVEKAPNGESTKAVDSLDGRNDSIVKHPSTDNPNNERGFIGRVKGYFFPSTSASTAIWSIAPHLTSPVREYTPKEREEAYMHPAIISDPPFVWIARDKYGLSKQEIEASTKEVGEGLEITDEGATFNEKGKVEWNQEDVKSAPLWEDEVVY